MTNAIKIPDHILKRIHLFQSLTTEEFELIKQHKRVIQLEAGENLFKQEQAAYHFYWLHQGQIKLYRISTNGNEKIIDIIQAQHSFAEAVMFMQRKSYPVNANALKPSIVLAFDNATFSKILQTSQQTCFRIMATMSCRLHQLINDIEELTLQQANSRLVHYLQQQIFYHQTQVPLSKPPIIIDLDISKQVLACRLSMKPETLSRSLKQLSQQHIISVNGSQITIINPEKLQHML